MLAARRITATPSTSRVCIAAQQQRHLRLSAVNLWQNFENERHYEPGEEPLKRTWHALTYDFRRWKRRYYEVQYRVYRMLIDLTSSWKYAHSLVLGTHGCVATPSPHRAHEAQRDGPRAAATSYRSAHPWWRTDRLVGRVLDQAAVPRRGLQGDGRREHGQRKRCHHFCGPGVTSKPSWTAGPP